MGGYCLLLVGVSLYFARMVKSSADLYLGSGKSGPWLNGLSFFMTAFSASVFVANASLAYRHGALNALLILAQVPVFVAGYYIFSARWHRTGCQTAVEFIQKRFGRPTARFFIGLGIPLRILDNANRLYVTAVLCEIVLGMSLFTGALLTLGVSLLSTVGGGFLAIVVTDAVQAVLLTLIVSVVAFLSWDKVGGWTGFAANVPESYWSLEGSQGFGLSLIVAWSFVTLFAWNGSWSLVQRFVAVPTERDARRVSLVAGVSYYILFPLIAVPAMAAVVLIPGLATPQQAESAYILVAEKVLPAGLMAMLCFGLLSATITALNSELNVIAHVVVNDVWPRRLARYSEAVRLWIGRGVMVAVGFVCFALALEIRDFGGAFKFLITVNGMTILPTFVPLLLGLLWPKATGRGAIAAFVAGISTSILLQFVFEWNLAAVIMANGLITIAVLLLSSRWPERDPDRRREVDSLFARLSRTQSAATRSEGVSPASSTGQCRSQMAGEDACATQLRERRTDAIARVAAIALGIAGLLALAAELLTTDTAHGRGVAAVVAAALFVIAGVVYYLHRPSRL